MAGCLRKCNVSAGARWLVVLNFSFSYKFQSMCILVCLQVGTSFFLNWCRFLDYPAQMLAFWVNKNVLHVVICALS